MTEENGTPKVETQYHAGSGDSALIPNDKRLVTKIGSTKKSLQKYEIYFLVPETDEECQARYGIPLSALIIKGVQGLSTGPNYPEVGFDFNVAPVITDDPKSPDKPFTDYPLKNDSEGNVSGHIEMQTLADGFQPGQRAAATGGQKAKAKKYDALNAGMAAMGITEAEIAECAGDQMALAGLMARKAKAFAKKAR